MEFGDEEEDLATVLEGMPAETKCEWIYNIACTGFGYATPTPARVTGTTSASASTSTTKKEETTTTTAPVPAPLPAHAQHAQHAPLVPQASHAPLLPPTSLHLRELRFLGALTESEVDGEEDYTRLCSILGCNPERGVTVYDLHQLYSKHIGLARLDHDLFKIYELQFNCELVVSASFCDQFSLEECVRIHDTVMVDVQTMRVVQ
jgi:hypothetical protein